MNPTSSPESPARSPRNPARRSVRSAAAWAAALLALYAVGVGLRRHVVRAQSPEPGEVAPFALESALQYRLIRRVFTGEGIPRHDPKIQVPEGIRTWAVDTTGAEVAVGHLARLFPRHLTLTQRIRWIHVLWFCLGIPMLAAWIRRETGSAAGGLTAGLLYATATASVIRSSGLEISHENMALPLLVAHLWAEAVAAARRRAGTAGTAASIASGLTLALALFLWDLVQFYTVVWALVRLGAWLHRPAGFRNPRVRHDLAVWTLLALAGAASPYLRTHGFLLSPTLLAGYGVAVGTAFSSRAAGRPAGGRAVAARILALAPFLALALPASGAYRESYGHFAELLWAKLRFLNRKPADPSELSFYARIMWTPALHSATVHLTAWLFPAFLGLTSGAAVVWFWPRAMGRAPGHTRYRFPVALFALSVAAYVLFVRFHVFVALFGSAVAGWTMARLAVPVRRATRVALALVAVTVAVETGFLLAYAGQWRRTGVEHEHLQSLAAWLRRHADGQPVLAPFGVSGTVLAYGQSPILLHPKFEAPDIRRRVETYGRLLFGRDEDALRDWAQDHGAVYLVVEAGQFEGAPEYQMRYFVDALEFSPDRLAWRLEQMDGSLELFRLLWTNPRYRVYRIARTDDEETWWYRRGAAWDALAEGRLDEAEGHAQQALQIRPSDVESLRVIARVTSLRRAGFRGDERP